ncbi:MAG: ABC transporter permease, partial [Gemmatimonadota bacterium]
LRQLRKHPAFTAAAVLTLGLGIGANTAIFSVVNGVLLRPLALPEPDRVITLEEQKLPDFTGFSVSPPNFLDYRSQNRTLTELAALNQGHYTLTGQGQPESIEGTSVTGGFFRVAGVEPSLGRSFRDEEMGPTDSHVVLIDHGMWQTRFGGDPAVLDRTLMLDGESYRVIGVMPAGFHYPSAGNELWFPLGFPADVERQRGAHYLDVIGRMKPEATLESTRADIAAVARRLQQDHPDADKGWEGTIDLLQDNIVGRIRPVLLLLLGAVGLVVLIGCVNVANLLLARAAGREGEIGIRTALGAGRGQLIRQLLTESLVLSVMGGLLAVLLAIWGIHLIVALGPQDIPRLDEVQLDGRVLGFTAGLVVLSAVLFGLWPALHATRPNLTRRMQLAGGRQAGHDPRGQRVRSALIVAEVALAVTLLMGAGLLIRSFSALTHVDAGFNSANVVSFDLSLPDSRYPDGDRTSAFYEQLLGRMAAMPGVTATGAIFGLPLSNFGFSSSIAIAGTTVAPENQPSAQVRLASRDFFRTMEIPLRRGRLFDATDRRGSLPVVLISESAARKFWPAGDAIGHEVTFGARPARETIHGVIVGIVGDVHAFGLAANLTPMFYAPIEQVRVGFASFVVRTNGAPSAVMASLGSQVHAIDPNLPVIGLTRLESVVGDSIARPRFYTLLLSIFAAVALTLAAIGVYGVFAYLISQRSREIGIRMALGADSGSLLRMVLGRAAALVGLGLALGLLGTVGLHGIMAKLLFGVRASDPGTLVAVVLLLSVVALVASYLPARRATKVDPAIVLRSE